MKIRDKVVIILGYKYMYTQQPFLDVDWVYIHWTVAFGQEEKQRYKKNLLYYETAYINVNKRASSWIAYVQNYLICP